jgi:hypothetical protein
VAKRRGLSAGSAGSAWPPATGNLIQGVPNAQGRGIDRPDAVAHTDRGSHKPACAASGTPGNAWPTVRIPQGERDTHRGCRTPLGIGCRVEAVNRPCRYVPPTCRYVPRLVAMHGKPAAHPAPREPAYSRTACPHPVNCFPAQPPAPAITTVTVRPRGNSECHRLQAGLAGAGAGAPRGVHRGISRGGARGLVPLWAGLCCHWDSGGTCPAGRYVAGASQVCLASPGRAAADGRETRRFGAGLVIGKLPIRRSLVSGICRSVRSASFQSSRNVDNFS